VSQDLPAGQEGEPAEAVAHPELPRVWEHLGLQTLESQNPDLQSLDLPNLGSPANPAFREAEAFRQQAQDLPEAGELVLLPDRV